MINIRLLNKADEAQLESLLARFPNTTMIIRGNLLKVGCKYSGAAFEGEYWGAFNEAGKLVAMVAHYWNDNLFMQAESVEELWPLARALPTLITRPVMGVIGDNEQAKIIVEALGLKSAEWALDSVEGLYALELASLNRQPPIPNSKIVPAREVDTKLLRNWRYQYDIEALNASPGPELEREALEDVERMQSVDDYWVLHVEGLPVSLSGFNARLPEIVQIGGVYTPPDRRGQGYARYLLGENLALAQQQGVRRAVLFTDTQAAVRAYASIGFKLIGQYYLGLLKQAVDIRTQSRFTN